jgi:hypothetical protein
VAEEVELVALGSQPLLDPLELGLDDRLAVAQHRDLPGELVDLVVVAIELGREHALSLLLRLQLGLLLLEPRLQVLPGRSGGAQRRQHDEEDGAKRRS